MALHQELALETLDLLLGLLILARQLCHLLLKALNVLLRLLGKSIADFF